MTERPLLVTGMARSGGSWVSRMLVAGGGLVHVNEPFNRRHPPGLSPGILNIPPPVAYQFVGPHNEAAHMAGFSDMLALRYRLSAELRANRSPYDLAKMARYLVAFNAGRARGWRPLVDDPYLVFSAPWMAERFRSQVVVLVRHPAGIVSSCKRIGTRWRDNLPAIAGQPELIETYLRDFEDEIERVASAPFEPIEQACLLYRLIHAAIAEQAAAHPEFVVVRYEDMAADPEAGFRDLYARLGLTYTDRAARAVEAGCQADAGQRARPWARVGFSKTAFQPMDSRANAYAWRTRLSPEEIETVLRSTRDVAGRFYSQAELTGPAPVTTGSQ